MSEIGKEIVEGLTEFVEERRKDLGMTKEQAIRLAESGWWKDKSAEEIVRFQLFEEKLCMDFSDFHAAVGKVFGRSVWTHEFADWERMKQEYYGLRGKPTMEEILAPIKDKMIVVVAEGQG